MATTAVPTAVGQGDPPTGNWQMGLKGIFALVANCTAIGLICLMFYQDRHEAMKQAREDRQMFRDELKQIRVGNHESSEKITRAVYELTNEIRKRPK